MGIVITGLTDLSGILDLGLAFSGLTCMICLLSFRCQVS